MLALQTSILLPDIRPLTALDTATYRKLRQKILNMGDGRYFSDSYTREAQLSHNQWKDWCTETHEHCIFGTFINDELIGVMMITQIGAVEDYTVEWEAIWLDPRYRRQGIAKLAYQQVQQWTLEHGYNYAALYIRADNQRSLDIHQKLGARYISTSHNDIWADGSIADCHAFIFDIQTLTSHQINKRTLLDLEQTFIALDDRNFASKAA